MLKELIAIGMATTLMTAPPQNANDETYYQDVNITESYEYETNEVNSVDDLVQGNIYHFEYNETIDSSKNFRILINALYHLEITDTTTIQATTQSNAVIQITSNGLFIVTENQQLTSANYNGYRTINADETINVSCDFVLNTIDLNPTYAIDYISASDYLGEKTITVERVETEGLYNLAYHFLYSRIYTNTELQSMETTLFGTTINMNMWLSHTTAIVIICLLLLVLIKFVIWLFKIVSGGMLWQ